MTKRTIYSIDEATKLTQQNEKELIALGCSGNLHLLVYVPTDIEIGNAGWGYPEKNTDPVKRAATLREFNQKPVRMPPFDLLVLDEDDCQKLQERGTLHQAEFRQVAVFGPESEIEIRNPLKPVGHPYNKPYAPMRVFATYERGALNPSFIQSDDVSYPMKELVITPSQLHIAAVELEWYLENREQKTSIQSLPSEPQATMARMNELRWFIKTKIYDPASPDEKKDDGALWRILVALAKQPAPDSLLIGFDEKTVAVLYKASTGGKGKLTRTQFNDRMSRIRLPS